jgi:hypothetical protein
MPLNAIDQQEAEYNARDVLSMCRMYPHLVEALERTDTVNVYEVDEQMADLALQMTRIGLPVDSEMRQAIGDRLRALRDEAVETMRPYTEGANRDAFIDWVSQFFAAKARAGEPVAGSVRLGPTRAAEALAELQAQRAQWKAYRKTLVPESLEEIQSGQLDCDTSEADDALNTLDVSIKTAKLDLKAAQFDTDECAGLSHTHESAFAQRMKIRRADFELALSKREVNFGAKVQQAAILRVAGVPLIKTTGKSGLPQIDKEVLKGFERHPAAKSLLRYILTDKTINVYIEGESRAGKSGGKAKPVMVTEDGYIHPLWGVHRITGRWNSSPNCFDGKTELYVRAPGLGEAWMSIAGFVRQWICFGARAFEVAQYNPETGNVEWVKPENPFEREFSGHMIELSGRVDLCVTPDHRLFLTTGLRLPVGERASNACALFDQARVENCRSLAAECMLSTPRLDSFLVFDRFAVDGKLSPATIKASYIEAREVRYVGPVFCLSVPSSYVVVRRNDRVCVVGQCQNWSKRAGGGEENLRAMICTPEGYIFVGADQKQLEARLVGAMSQCKYLLDVFKRGEDVHAAFAAVGFPDVWPRLNATYLEHKKAVAKGTKCSCSTCAERDKVRDLTKRLEYGTIYGGQDKAIWEALVGDFPSLTQQQVRMFIVSASRMMPEMVTWRERTLQEAIKLGEIRSPILGRRQVFPLGRVDPTVAYNYKAQSGGADLWALGAIDFCARWGQHNQVDARLIHNGHDSVLVLCREDLAKQVEHDVYECWSREWAEMPFEMETKIAKRWSET